MKTAENRKHAAAIAAACIALVALVVLGTVIISYWNGSRIMDSLILPSDIDSEWMFWQDDMLWCDAAGEQLIVLLHRDADGGFAETGTPVLVIAPAETEQEAQALLQSLRETRADDAETQRLIEPFLK